MRDRPFIVGALAVFVAVATFPVWYNVAARTPAAPPALARPSDAAIERVRASLNPAEGGAHESIRTCVAPREFMRASHMQMLVGWREDVVRRGDRVFADSEGRRYEKNLTGTCLGCHGDRQKFCDRCHDYAGVSPGCPDCHQAPQVNGRR